MQYEVGNVIRIRKDLVVGEWYGDDNFNKDMSECRGKFLTVSEVIPYMDGFVYVTKEYHNWVFTTEMIEYAIEVPRYTYNKFEKVSKEQYIKDVGGFVTLDAKKDMEELEELKKELADIYLPQRKTECSAGYDFHMPCSITLFAHDTLVMPTGIKCYLEKDKVLQIYPRSGLAFKYGMHLANGVGIIDADYVYADNEGHIMIKLINPSNQDIEFKKGDAFAQGFISTFYKTVDDEMTAQRVGGMGSTGR